MKGDAVSNDERSVLIAVLTYQRLEMLGRLLPMLEKQIDEVDQNAWHVGVLVVDNDGAASARDVVLAVAPETHYEVEPVPGIARARNHALDAAGRLGARLLIFIDDDEEPRRGWLTALLKAHEAHQGAAVAGSVVSRIEGDVDPWLIEGGFYRRAHRLRYRTGDTVSSAATNNLLLDLRVVERLNLRFDESLGLAGGEDTRFTLQLSGAGESIIWCPEAVVVDVVTPERARRKVALRRVYSASNGSISAILATSTSRRERVMATARYTATGLGRVVLGSAQAVAGTVTRRTRWQAHGVRTVARGAGTLSGLVGRTYAEYQRKIH